MVPSAFVAEKKKKKKKLRENKRGGKKKGRYADLHQPGKERKKTKKRGGA